VEDEERIEYYVLTYYRFTCGWLLTGDFPYNTELWSIKPEVISLIEEAH